MGTYKEIRGTHITTVTSDPPAPVNGQMWYNSTTRVMKGFTSSPAGTWSTAANMNTARHSGIASAGANAEAALGFGGGPPPAPGAVAITESWNGSTWTEVADLNTARALAGGAGNYTSAIAAGGDQYSGNSESWNGSSWTNITTSPNTGHTQQGAGADNEDAILFGGSPYATNNNSDYWNGSSWTELANLNTARQAGAGSGKTYTAALAMGGWTEIADLNLARAYMGADGTQTSTLAFGGNTGPPNKSETESWNGSSWTETGDLNTARSYLGRGGANNTSALAFSGAPSAATEEFVTPTTSTVTFTAS
jgi:hypothetical protein